MEKTWPEIQAYGIEVEETELAIDEFEYLFCNEADDNEGEGRPD